MSTVQIVCPHCGLSKSVPREKIPARTKSINCPKCKGRFPIEMDADFTYEDGEQKALAPVRPVNKVALLVITFFLGGIGGHKFYLHKYLQGVLYLLFCWTAIPSLVAFVEFIIYAIRSEAELQQMYS